MRTTAATSTTDLAALIAAAPQADATQQHITDEVEHPDIEATFYRLAELARVAPAA